MELTHDLPRQPKVGETIPLFLRSQVGHVTVYFRVTRVIDDRRVAGYFADTPEDTTTTA